MTARSLENTKRSGFDQIQFSDHTGSRVRLLKRPDRWPENADSVVAGVCKANIARAVHGHTFWIFQLCMMANPLSPAYPGAPVPATMVMIPPGRDLADAATVRDEQLPSLSTATPSGKPN